MARGSPPQPGPSRELRSAEWTIARLHSQLRSRGVQSHRSARKPFLLSPLAQATNPRTHRASSSMGGGGIFLAPPSLIPDHPCSEAFQAQQTYPAAAPPILLLWALQFQHSPLPFRLHSHPHPSLSWVRLPRILRRRTAHKFMASKFCQLQAKAWPACRLCGCPPPQDSTHHQTPGYIPAIHLSEPGHPAWPPQILIPLPGPAAQQAPLFHPPASFLIFAWPQPPHNLLSSSTSTTPGAG